MTLLSNCIRIPQKSHTQNECGFLHIFYIHIEEFLDLHFNTVNSWVFVLKFFEYPMFFSVLDFMFPF
jgi:hypothetical protein